MSVPLQACEQNSKCTCNSNDWIICDSKDKAPNTIIEFMPWTNLTLKYQHFEISNKNIKYLNEAFLFQGFQFNYLKLESNEIEFISNETFQNLIYVKQIHLRFNKLSNIDFLIDSDSFSKLYFLYLSFNQIKKLDWILGKSFF